MGVSPQIALLMHQASFRVVTMHHILCAKPALSDLWVGHISWVRNVVLTTKYGDAEAVKVAEEQVVQKGKGLANSRVYPERRFSCDV
jgi:hypothetical protein